jgi:predicted amidohydrolase YtcJ
MGNFMKGILTMPLFLICSGISLDAQTPATARPMTVFVAEEIITMDPGWPEATAVAVRNGRIISIGSLDDLKPRLDKNPYKINRTFEDNVLLLGFIEPHGH